MKKLTKKQKIVYYWLLLNSFWEQYRDGKHYFLFRKDFKLCTIGKETGISDKTIRTALKKLEFYGYIYRDGWQIKLPFRDKHIKELKNEVE